jgi:hypothetical protein
VCSHDYQARGGQQGACGRESFSTSARSGSSKESDSALTRDLQSPQASTDTQAQNKLHALGDEKKTQEQLLESTRKMLSEHDYSSSVMISSVVAHAVPLLKSYLSDLDIELLQQDYPFDDDEERDALIDSVYDTAQHFMSQYDFCVVNDQGDKGSPGA